MCLPLLFGKKLTAALTPLIFFFRLHNTLRQEGLLSFASQDHQATLQISYWDGHGIEIAGVVWALVNLLLAEIFIVTDVALFIERALLEVFGRLTLLFGHRLADHICYFRVWSRLELPFLNINFFSNLHLLIFRILDRCICSILDEVVVYRCVVVALSEGLLICVTR